VSRTDAPAPLSVTTDDLTLTVDDIQIDVRSTGDRVFLEVPTVREALRVARSLPPDADASGPTRLLAATDLTTEVRVRGRTVAVLGAAARPGPLAANLGVAPAEIRLGGVIGAGWSGLSAAADAVRRRFG
jgi:hypothetical protein